MRKFVLRFFFCCECIFQESVFFMPKHVVKFIDASDKKKCVSLWVVFELGMYVRQLQFNEWKHNSGQFMTNILHFADFPFEDNLCEKLLHTIETSLLRILRRKCVCIPNDFFCLSLCNYLLSAC